MAESRTEENLEPYKLKLRSVVQSYFKYPTDLSRIVDHLYIGGERDAKHLKQLRDIGITHVINCAELYCQTGAAFYGNAIKYYSFPAEDCADYDILQHHNDVYKFIEDARKSGGKCFIHCQMGVNRSGVLAISYVMVHRHIGPIAATRMVKRIRGAVLTNLSFQSQLIEFANSRGLLILDKHEI